MTTTFQIQFSGSNPNPDSSFPSKINQNPQFYGFYSSSLRLSLMDPYICRWISEFLIRNAVQDHVIKKLLQVLPVSADSRFKKTVLLRTIQDEISDASASETVLDKLEMMEELDRDDGIGISGSLKKAYGAVAVECVVKYLVGSPDGHGKYFEAVKRVFRDRVGDMENLGKSELVTDELRRVGDELEAAVWDAKVATRLLKMNTRDEALEAVRVYLREAWDLMGHSFLESAAAVTEPSVIHGSSSNAGELAAKNTPNAGQDKGELTKMVNRIGEVVLCASNGGELAAKTVSQVEAVAARRPNGGESAAKKANQVAGNTLDAGELAAKTVNQVEEVAAGRPNVGESAAKTANQWAGNTVDVGELEARTLNHSEELAANLPNECQDAVELPVETANGVVATTNAGLELLDNGRPELCDSQGRRSEALPRGSWDSVVRDRAAAGKETQPENLLPRRKHVLRHKRSRGGVKITDPEEVEADASCSKHDSLPTPEVNKVREALKSSSLELQAVVKDPLPEALRLAETVLSSMVTKDKQHGPSVENQDERSGGALNPFADKSVEPEGTNDSIRANQSHSNQRNAPRLSLMERNSTAHTYEWEDSIDDSPEGNTEHGNRPCLPSPKRKDILPLKKYENANVSKRRKVKRWSLLEEDTLRAAVHKYGKGNWKLILNCYREIFEERTEVDLKDKWRNMTRS